MILNKSSYSSKTGGKWSFAILFIRYGNNVLTTMIYDVTYPINHIIKEYEAILDTFGPNASPAINSILSELVFSEAMTIHMPQNIVIAPPSAIKIIAKTTPFSWQTTGKVSIPVPKTPQIRLKIDPLMPPGLTLFYNILSGRKYSIIHFCNG